MPATQNTPLLRALAAELRSRRAALALSQDELAFRAGLNRTFIGKIEISKNQPTLTAMHKLATGLEVGLDELMVAVMQRYEKETKHQGQ
jgi:transcriptional regulator with XRE-family HTH domain